MPDDTLLELVNLSIDGEATEEQRAALAELVRSSPDAQTAARTISEVAQRLDMAMREDLPPGTRGAILSVVSARKPAHRRSGAVVPFARPLRRRLLFVASWAAVAAAVLSVLVLAPMRFIGRSANTPATMAHPASFGWPVAATVRVGRTTLVVRRSGDSLLLEPVVPTRPANISIAWPAGEFAFAGMAGGRDGSSGDGFAAFVLASPGERGGVVVRPRKGIHSAEIRVEVNSREVLRAVVPLR